MCVSKVTFVYKTNLFSLKTLVSGGNFFLRLGLKLANGKQRNALLRESSLKGAALWAIEENLGVMTRLLFYSDRPRIPLQNMNDV